MRDNPFYKKEFQEKYAKSPWSEVEPDTDPEEFVDSMIKTFEDSGILDLIKKERVSMLAPSVSTGKKDWAFLKKLDEQLEKSGKFHRPSIILTDFALTEKGKSIIKKPEEEFKNLDARIVACDSYHLPFKENEFNVIYERLGALWHAADEDIKERGKGALIRNIIEEYKRVVKPNGKIIFDYNTRRGPAYSTSGRIHAATNEDAIVFLKKLGLKTEVVGKNEFFVVLTIPDKE